MWSEPPALLAATVLRGMLHELHPRLDELDAMQEYDVYDLLLEATPVENIVSTENRILDKWVLHSNSPTCFST